MQVPFRSCLVIAILATCCLLPAAACGDDVLSLAGQWKLKLDPKDVGVAEKWFERGPDRAPWDKAVTVHLPGSTDEAKAGMPNPKPPSLDGLYRPNVYAGAAWYQREIEIPEAWKEKYFTLLLERVHWVTKVWIDDVSMDAQDSLIAPHAYQLGGWLKPGKHRITVLVDNTVKINLGHFVSILYEGTQTNWNGIVGRMELQAHDPVWITGQRVDTENDGTVWLKLDIGDMSGRPVAGTISVTVTEKATGKVVGRGSGKFEHPVGLGVDGRHIYFTYTTEKVALNLDSPPKLWSEFDPSLYVLQSQLKTNGKPEFTDTAATTFGFREFGRKGTQFTMNGRPVFLRGTLECAIFPLTGYPPCDVPAWQRIYRIMKSYGLNFIRFHSWCPPEAAFEAADIEGIMIQAEGPQANVPAGQDPRRDAFTEQELLRMIRTYGNHPSFCLMTLGNEYGGKDEVLSRWVDMLIKEDPRHLYSSASSAQKTANRQFTEAGPRGIHGPGTTTDFRSTIEKLDRPLIGHEIGQWTFYPNFEEIKKYTGVLEAKNFEIVRDDLKAKSMLDLAPRFFEATGKHAVLLYKEEIEVLMRTPGHAGFSLLDLHDYPGQGTALIGPLDPFWDSKGFVAPEVHRQYCGPTVPLARLPKRTYTTDETLECAVDIAHFGPSDLKGVEPQWTLMDEEGREVAAGKSRKCDLPTGKLSPLGAITAPLSKVAAPCKLKLTISLAPGSSGFQSTQTLVISPIPGRSRIESNLERLEIAPTNTWDIWVYPANVSPQPPADLIVSHRWDDATKTALADGKKVFLMLSGPGLGLSGSFKPVFWSPVWFPKQKPNTMGILCDPKHPAFAQFPTEFYSNWQWWDLIEGSRSMILDDTPADFRPTVQVIDNFARNHKLGNLLEARVGKGRLMVSTLNLAQPDKNIAARQMLVSLYAYLSSDRFRPEKELDAATLDKLFASGIGRRMTKSGAKVIRTDSQQEGFEGTNVLDGDPETMWHTEFGERQPGYPHELVVEFPQPVTMLGCTLLPRQDRNRNGLIKDFAIYVSDDGKTWRSPVAKGAFEKGHARKTVKFAQVAKGKYLRFVALSALDGKLPFAALAELEIIEPPASGKGK